MRDPFGFLAGVVEDWPSDNVRLQVIHRAMGVAGVEVLMQDGTWSIVDEGVEVSGAGIVLPKPAIAAVYDGLCEYRGLRPHQATEAKVLREWLQHEQSRVDRFLERDR